MSSLRRQLTLLLQQWTAGSSPERKCQNLAARARSTKIAATASFSERLLGVKNSRSRISQRGREPGSTGCGTFPTLMFCYVADAAFVRWCSKSFAALQPVSPERPLNASSRYEIRTALSPRAESTIAERMYASGPDRFGGLAILQPIEDGNFRRHTSLVWRNSDPRTVHLGNFGKFIGSQMEVPAME